MSIHRVNILSDPSSNVRQLNKNTGGENINKNINGKNISQSTDGHVHKHSHNHNHVGRHKHKHRHNHNHVGGHKLNTGIKNIFKPSINIEGLSTSPGKSPNININLIINLLCFCLKGQSTSSANDAGSTSGTGSTTNTGTQPKAKNTKTGYSPLIDKLTGPEKDYALRNDLSGKGPDGKPKYLIANGKDGKPHLYRQKKPGEYEAPVKVADGNNQLDLGKNPNITTDKNGISQASGKDVETSSPLILDANKDGKVSAQHGIGVDVNGDNRADGAAVGGDKMLTMGDRNGNGKIDGTEVFGDKTVDPFTNKPINAKNGFEALRKVALSTQQATGINIVDSNGKVDVQKLNQALQSAKKGQLGMISGNNTTKPEALGDVASIDTQGYKEQAATGNVQHRQLGSYTDTQGGQHKVNDVWFKHA